MIGVVDLLPQYVHNYIIDPQWTRVRIPVADFGLVVPKNISRVYFNSDDIKVVKTFYLDEIRFIADCKKFRVWHFLLIFFKLELSQMILKLKNLMLKNGFKTTFALKQTILVVVVAI